MARLAFKCNKGHSNVSCKQQLHLELFQQEGNHAWSKKPRQHPGLNLAMTFFSGELLFPIYQISLIHHYLLNPTPILTYKCNYYTPTTKFLFAASGDHHRNQNWTQYIDQCITEIPTLTDTAALQLLLYGSKNNIEEGLARKVVRARYQEVCCETFSPINV